ncbi:MAG: CoA-binding protein, partial [Shimia sp.]|nr:CoA-binding protein [Shimia sp.]
VVDYPPENRQDWDCATAAAIKAKAATGRPMAVVASLPELMPADTAAELIAGGVVPMYGLREAIEAAAATLRIRAPEALALALPGEDHQTEVLDEGTAKLALAKHGFDVPKTVSVAGENGLGDAAEALQAPLVLKGRGIAHKTEAGAVKLGLSHGELDAAAAEMPTESFLVEEMIDGGVAELLVGVTRDPAHGFVLTLAAGGVLTELLADSTSLLVPASRESIKQSLTKLKTSKLLLGYRGAEAANMEAVLDAVEALQAYVLANVDSVDEAEVNPLICTPTRAVAADALIRKAL